MESITELQINLFADDPPSLEQIIQLSMFVHSGEKNLLDFSGQVDENMSKSSPTAFPAVGIGLYILGKDGQAVENLNEAKDSKEKFIYLAFALRRTGQFDQAVENLQKSLKFGADSLSIALEKAETYRSASNFNAAEKELKACSNFENISADYHYQLGRLKEAQGLYLEAMEDYKTALGIRPEHAKALFHLAYRCDLSGDEDAAIDYYRQVACTSPVYVNALLNLAVLYEDASRFDRAAECINNVLKHHPNHQRALLFQKDIEGSKTMFYDEEKEQRKSHKNKILETPISDFELSVRSRNCLRKMNILTIGDLLRITEVELLSYKNFGETSLREIKVILESKSLQLGMALEESQSVPEQISDYNSDEDLEEKQTMLTKPIVDDLQLSVRARKCLRKLDIRTLADLISHTEAELLGCKNFGVTSLNEIKKALTDLGLSLRKLD